MKKLLFIVIFPTALAAQSPVKYVDPLIGTGPARTASALKHSESASEEKGQNFPGVGRPFGITQWTPETRTTEDKCISPYYYNDKYITGFRGSHWMSGSCTQDYGSLTLMPFMTAVTDTLIHTPVSKFSHRNEALSPAYYRLVLDNSGIVAELTGSVRSGLMRFTFPGKSAGYIFLRMNSDEKVGKVWVDYENNEICGFNPVHRIYQGRGQPAGFSGYFVIRFDKPFHPIPQLLTQQQMAVGFNNEQVVIVRIGTSFTGIDAARKNLDREIPEGNFEAVRKASEDVWNQTLGKIQVRGGSEEDRIKFYTALYHCYQLPRIVSDADGSYQGFSRDSLIHKAQGFDYYDDFSMWDTYRALHPLMTILEPGKTLDMVKSLILKAQQGGWMPIFPAWSNYTAAMIGDHVSTTIADAYMKGIKDFDTETAWKYMRRNAFEIPPQADYKDGKGRRALESYLKYGYIPLEDSVWDAFHRREQVSRTMEYAFDDYALARFAKALGKTEDYNTLIKRSENWKNVFDKKTGFVRGRSDDGRWIEPFYPYSKASYICEGTSFQYTWYVPQDIPGLEQAMGGRDSLLTKLNEFFDKGYYWHGNEPNIHSAYLFNEAGRPDLTQKWSRWILDNKYDVNSEGVDGNDDGATLSSWYIFASLGFYPIAGSDYYELGAPLFKNATIQMADRTLQLIAENYSPENRYVSKIWLNGKLLKGFRLRHSAIAGGGALKFEMSALPVRMNN